MTTPYFGDFSWQALMRESPRTVATRAPVTLVTATTVFTVNGGPIHIHTIVSECIVVCDGTAATLQWSADGTVGAAVTITGASASLANFAAGGFVVCNFTAVTTAPDLITAGVGLGPIVTRGIIVPAGIITTTIGSGPSTGTFKHYMRYTPLAPNVVVSAEF